MKISSCLILAAHISFLSLSEYFFSLFLPLPIWQAGKIWGYGRESTAQNRGPDPLETKQEGAQTY